jgi:hypothetical protein
MTWGVHPAITYDKSLEVGQVVEARFTDDHQAVCFPARIVSLSEHTALVESLEESVNGLAREFVIQRFSSPLWSRNNGLYPRHMDGSAFYR